MVVNDPEYQSSIMMLLSWLEVHPCVRSLEYCNHLIPNQRSSGDERVSDWNDIFRVSSKQRIPTENRYLSDNILIMCEVLASIIAVSGITYGNRRYQVITQPAAEGFSIHSKKSSGVLFHRLQGLGTVPWNDGRYHFRVLVGSLHAPLVIHCEDLGDIKKCVHARASNTFKSLI